jgi:hypothetical protein
VFLLSLFLGLRRSLGGSRVTFFKIGAGCSGLKRKHPTPLLDVPASSAWFHPIISPAKNTAYHIGFSHGNAISKSFDFMGTPSSTYEMKVK